MLFHTDKQTLDDLNIYGKQGTNSIYTLFNHTFTSSGAAILEEMFRYPMADVNAINERSGIISQLAATGAVFPFRAELFDSAEQYLSVTDERTRLSQEKPALDKRVTNLIAADNDYKIIYNGITALIEIVQKLTAFIATMDKSQPSPYDTTREIISGLLAEDVFDGLLQENLKNKLPYAKIVAYDNHLRFRHPAAVKKLLRHIYYLDAYIAVANVTNQHGFVFPRALPKERGTNVISGFYHPQVKGAVANSLRITPDSNLIFLTGANMAGKSTLMKSLGVAMYLAHMGFPVPAEKMEFSVMDGIYTTINLADNLSIGASHFYAEVLRIKKVAQELSTSKNIFVIFDELFRGTNVKDAYEATIAVTEAFAKKRNSIFVISTHIIEAGDVLKERCGNISFKYLPTLMKGSIPMYPYILEEGITADRHGMIIINNEGIIDLLKNGKTKVATS